MALILRGRSTCSICGQILEAGQQLVTFPPFLPRTDLHFRHADAGMHQTCFDAWEHRDAFVRKYRVAIGEIHEPERIQIAVLGGGGDCAELREQLRNRQPKSGTE